MCMVYGMALDDIHVHVARYGMVSHGKARHLYNTFSPRKVFVYLAVLQLPNGHWLVILNHSTNVSKTKETMLLCAFLSLVNSQQHEY